LRHAVAARQEPVEVTGDAHLAPRLRSFIGTILIIVLVIVYAVTATSLASLLLATSPWWVHFLYFLLSGLLWILPAMFIIKWMAGPRPKQ
jgi:hypothetical protein